MNIALLGKLLIGGATLVGASVITLWHGGLIDKWMYKGVEIYVTAATKTGSDIEKKPFKCKFKDDEDSEGFACTITKQTLSDVGVQNHASYEVFSNGEAEVSEIKSTEWASGTGHVYKITITDQYDKRAKFAEKAIEIFSTPEKSNKLEVTEWFVVDKSDNSFSGKTKYFIGKSSVVKGDSQSSDNKCAFAEDGITDTDIASLIFDQACTMQEFSTTTTTTLSESTFTSSTSDVTTFTADKYYLITFTDKQTIIPSDSKQIIFANTGDDVATKNATFKEIHSAALAKDKLLVLKI